MLLYCCVGQPAPRCVRALVMQADGHLTFKYHLNTYAAYRTRRHRRRRGRGGAASRINKTYTVEFDRASRAYKA